MRRAAAIGLPAASLALGAGALALGRLRDAGPLPAPPDCLITVDGERIHCVERGSGPAVVLIHGLFGSAFSFRDVVDGLAEEFRVVALDLPGFGYSDREPVAPLSLEGHARRVLRLLDELGIERALFVGHSMGSGVAARVAIRAPGRVDGVLLVAPYDLTAQKRWQSGRSPATRVAMRLTVRAAAELPPLLYWLVERNLRLMAAREEVVTPEMVRGYARPLLVPGTTRCLGLLAKSALPEPPANLRAIAAPALVLCGAADNVTPPADGRRVAAAIPGARYVELPGVGHLFPDEAPGELAAAIRGFAREARAPGG